jgi:hypothetical protein
LKPNKMTAQGVAHTQAATQSRRSRVGEWTKLIALTGSAQVIVQTIGIWSELFFIRQLSYINSYRTI